MLKEEVKREIALVYSKKGLNGVYAFLKKNKIRYELAVIEFGLHTNKKAQEQKEAFLKADPLNFHYYSLLRRGQRNGYKYNVLRGLKITLL